MHGKERESRQRTPMPKTTIGSKQFVDLTTAEKSDLVLFSGTAAYQAILKLLELMLIESRDEAALIPPHKRDERLAALDTAYAVSKVMLGLKDKMDYLVGEHLGEFKRRQAEEMAQDQEQMEAIMLDPINVGH